jgi:hypothetical protein
VANPDRLYFAGAAVRILCQGVLPTPEQCTVDTLGDDYFGLVQELAGTLRQHHGSTDPVTVRAMMRDAWLAASLDPRYHALADHVGLLDLDDAAEASMNGNGQQAVDPPLNSHNSLNSHQRQEKIPWPTLDKPKALYGPAGVLTAAIDEYTEADPAAILLNTLTAFGNVVGTGPYFQVEYSQHPLRLFGVFVGESSKGRKGLSWSTPRHVFRAIDQVWVDTCVTSGLSSGEGLIYHVRDQRLDKQPVKQKGRVVDYEEVVVDQGVSDKRLFVIEEEFAQALKVMRREGNILSPVLREAWDTGNLHPMTKSNPVRATDAHISIVGHITRDELLRHLDSTEQANGFANRFLWVLVKRSKVIPDPTGVPERLLTPLIMKLSRAVEAARKIGKMTRDEGARHFWNTIYPELSEGKPGLFGHITGRAEAQVMRLSCLYAALDCTCRVSTVHLEAGLAVWRYCEASARYIFGDATGDPLVDDLIALLRGHADGLTRTEISHHFGRHKSTEELSRALNKLTELNMAACREEDTGGRKAERWVAVA